MVSTARGISCAFIFVIVLVSVCSCQAFAPKQCVLNSACQRCQRSPPASGAVRAKFLLSFQTRQNQPELVRSTVTSQNLALDGFTEVASSVFRVEGQVPFVQALGLNVALFVVLNRKLLTMLTPAGFAHSLALGTLLWTTLGWRGWSLCVLYLFLGQLVTKIKFEEKSKRGLAEKRGGRRGPENVWGSAATGLVCAACAAQGDEFLGISSQLYLVGYVASLATKLADTFASEIGKAYGKTTFLITTLKRVEPGTEGAVSAEGTAAAVLGGLLLSAYGWAIGLISAPAIIITTMSAFVATNLESVLGATLQEKEGMEWITNEVVNFINTLIGAGIAILGAALPYIV